MPHAILRTLIHQHNGMQPEGCKIEVHQKTQLHMWVDRVIIMGILATPPKATPLRNKALLRAY